MPHERREKIVRLRCHDVIDLFNAIPRSRRYIALPMLPELPEGYHVVSVTANWAAKTIDLLVHHDSWDAIPDGMMATEFQEGPLMMEKVYIEVLPPHPDAPLS